MWLKNCPPDRLYSVIHNKRSQYKTCRCENLKFQFIIALYYSFACVLFPSFSILAFFSESLLPPFILSPSALISFIKYFTLQTRTLIMFVDSSDCLTGHARSPANKFFEVYLQGLWYASASKVIINVKTRIRETLMFSVLGTLYRAMVTFLFFIRPETAYCLSSCDSMRTQDLTGHDVSGTPTDSLAPTTHSSSFLFARARASYVC